MAETGTKTASRTDGKGKTAGAKKQAKPRRSAKSRAVEKVARSYFDAIAAKDAEAAAGHWAEDGVDDVVPLAVLRGREQIRAFMRESYAAVPDADWAVKRVVADDRHAVVEWRMRGTFSGSSFQGIEPTGKHVELRGLDLLEVDDDQIVSNSAYYDGAAFARQVGMMPSQDSGAERAMKSAFNAVTRLRKVVDERTGS
jgi:steroid delta-isomerase-like uncharacterized protein